MYDIKQRCNLTGRTVRELLEELRKLNPEAELCCCGDSCVFLHVEKDGSLVSLDTEDLDECYENSDDYTLEAASKLHECDEATNLETLRERDERLEILWALFSDVPMNPETECIEEKFLGWGPGIHREEIWHWFDRRHSKGVAYLLYGGAEDYVPETKRLYALKQLCIECESSSCQYNHGGECRFALVHERKPRINDVDGCIDYDYQEGED